MTNRIPSSYTDVEVTSTDDVSIAFVTTVVGGQIYLAEGTSRRDPVDVSDPSIGVKLALGRALRDAGRQLLNDANAQVRYNEKARLTQEDARRRAQRRKRDQRRRDAEVYADVRRQSAAGLVVSEPATADADSATSITRRVLYANSNQI